MEFSENALSVFVSDAVILPNSKEPLPATIEVDTNSGKILNIHHKRLDRQRYPQIPDDCWIDAKNKWILPGLVDSHVHLNEPGRREWEGFWTGTRAAVSGGVTTVIDMPLNSIPPTTTNENLEVKKLAARDQIWADVGFWGGVIPGNQSNIRPLIRIGVKGFKCFLIESGVEEFPCVSKNDVALAMSELKGTNSVLQFHAELETGTSKMLMNTENTIPSLYSTFLNSRPQKLEVDAIDLIMQLQQEHPSVRCHIVHLSAASALPAIRKAKAAGAMLSVETCFHYLTLCADDIPDGRPEFKCCPPVRDSNNRDLLWQGLIDGTIDFVVSDHSPCVSELKHLDSGNIMSAWGGISTLGLGLSVLWTEASKRDIDIGQIMQWTSQRTAKHASIDHRKGAIKIGYDADLIIFDPIATYQVTKEKLNFKNKVSPYEGLTLQGIVQKTYLRGRLVWDYYKNIDELNHRPHGIFI